MSNIKTLHNGTKKLTLSSDGTIVTVYKEFYFDDFDALWPTLNAGDRLEYLKALATPDVVEAFKVMYVTGAMKDNGLSEEFCSKQYIDYSNSAGESIGYFVKDFKALDQTSEKEVANFLGKLTPIEYSMAERVLLKGKLNKTPYLTTKLFQEAGYLGK